MSDENMRESMLDMFIFETSQLIEQLEQLILTNEKSKCFNLPAINEIFRIMHTIKGSSAMMLYDGISSLAHSMEDLFFFLREETPEDLDLLSLCSLLLEGVDFVKDELEKIKIHGKCTGKSESLIKKIKDFLNTLKQKAPASHLTQEGEQETLEKQQYYIGPDKSAAAGYNNYRAVIYFEDGCEMENIRAFNIVHNLKDMSNEVLYFPEDIIENDDSAKVIKEKGFEIFIKTLLSMEEIHKFFIKTVFLKDLELRQLEDDAQYKETGKKRPIQVEQVPIKVPVFKEDYKMGEEPEEKGSQTAASQSIISVNVNKLDKLMDLVGELVISEAMVTQNPDLMGLELENFYKSARQLRKITSELQDMVMSIRMVPLVSTFQKMNRVVYDMCRKQDKEVKLEIAGEETEVDKNIIEQISDPLMHLVRNAVDHGIEPPEDRRTKGKPETGKLTLEAKNAGSDVLLIVKDDGKGLNREAILKKAVENSLLNKPAEDMTEKEIFSLILFPGFSTKGRITEFSGRGVGMDVVTKNIEKVGGNVTVDSIEGEGTSITLKIPLTLAIIDGMNIRVGNARYTIPIMSIRESFRAEQKDIVTDPDENEMIMVRGQFYPVLRLHEVYSVKTDISHITEGIIVMVESGDKTLCIFADELLGEQQVVVKTLPGYIKSVKDIESLAGCTILGDGSISLILDIAGLLNSWGNKISTI